MPDMNHASINIAIVGGGEYCKEILEKTVIDYKEHEVNARFVAVADPDPKSPGRVLADQLGMITLDDYHLFYDAVYQIGIILISIPDQDVLNDILATKPSHIRLMAYHAFDISWKAIRIEEKKLRERNEEIETILNGIEDFILVITPEKRILEVNAAFLRQMRLTQEDVVGHLCYEVFQRASRKTSNCHLVCPLEKVIREEKPCTTVLTRLTKSGEQRYAELTIFPIWDKEGQISKFIEISRDITKRKQEEEELANRLVEEEDLSRRLEKMVEQRTRQLKETHEKLLHQDKMASLGKLSASVVHEINNPIAGILNLVLLIKRMMREEIAKNESDRMHQYLDLMETETRRISRIVSNLLMFSRQSKMEFQEVDINKIVEKTLFLNENLFRINGIKVKEGLRPKLPKMIGSEDQLQQVFMNIVSNAAEAMSGARGGTLAVETSFLEKEDQIRVRFKDSGVGIPKENMSVLFEPFFTTKKKGKGVGLGLSVAYGIIKEHGGSIYANSKAGKGTTFEISFPRVVRNRSKKN